MTLSEEGKARVVVLDKRGGSDKEMTRIVLADGEAGEDSKLMTLTGEGDEEPGIHVIRIRDDEGKILRCPR
jgi:hypothetical protein